MISNLGSENGRRGGESPAAKPSNTNSSAPAQSAAIADILERHGRKPSRLVPILQEVQARYRYLPRDVLTNVARSLNIAPARVFGAATFYAHFAIKPKGRHLIRLCDGTACHVKESIPILDAVRKKLGLDAKHPTTPDLLFTVETVACLGACGLAPVVVIDDHVHGQMTPVKATTVVEALLKQDQGAAS